MEQTLGHRAHSLNLRQAVPDAPVVTDVFQIEYEPRGRVPLPWAVRASIEARRTLRGSGNAYAVTFYHTQSVALLAPFTPRNGRFVISVDATPLQMDGIAEHYGHRVGRRLTESTKRHLYARVFQEASAVVAWSDWARRSLVDDYGVPADKTVVIHPGAPDDFFRIERCPAATRKPRILFVGGDFQRKGGGVLLEAFQRLSQKAELVIVSESEVPPGDGIEHHRGVVPGSSRLFEAFSDADVFCLPTLADCTPVAIGEALAAGLPVVTTDVGSNSQVVRHGVTGLLTQPADPNALYEALLRLVTCASERHEMGRRAREEARDRFNSRTNSHRILNLLSEVAS
jgi:glycosyltransferase involved in cell wall biosynthesis